MEGISPSLLSEPCLTVSHHTGKRPKMSQRPYLLFFTKPANFIFKFLSLKISLIQADCHRKQIFVVRSTRFHGLEQSLEILPERDSDLLASLDKGIVHYRSQCALNTTEEQRALALYSLGYITNTASPLYYKQLRVLFLEKSYFILSFYRR